MSGNDISVERMDDFFSKRVEGYEDHMLNSVEGCRDGYQKIAQLIPENCSDLLDIGCGTGLELTHIFERFPNLHVVGIDYTQAMLDKLLAKYPLKNIDLIHGDYFKVDFGIEKYDCVISFETLHHFPAEDKAALYKKIWHSLRNDGYYIEFDFLATDIEQEAYFHAEYEKIKREDVVIHFDTPCCAETQLCLFTEAGFVEAEKLWQIGYNAMFKMRKSIAGDNG